MLGSAQPGAHVDPLAATKGGYEIARRRSGGGAVLVGPGRCLWVDVLITPEDPRWDDDVRRAPRWVGEAWADALDAVGLPGGEVVATMEPSPWSSWMCFAGAGPGEVRLGGRKVVGVAQRRTRWRALFQCAVLLDDDPAGLLGVLALSDEQRRQAAATWAEGVGAVSPERAGPLLEALGAALAQR